MEKSDQQISIETYLFNVFLNKGNLKCQYIREKWTLLRLDLSTAKSLVPCFIHCIQSQVMIFAQNKTTGSI